MSAPQPLKLLSLNCYLVPQLFSFKKVNITCKNQDERAKLIGQFVAKKQFDVALFQEMWGSHVDKVFSQILPRYTTTPNWGSWGIRPTNGFANFFGYKGSFVDPLVYWAAKTGGLMIASKSDSIPILHSDKHTFTVSESWSMKGVQVALLDVSKLWGEKRLLMVFNTHLDPNNQDNKVQQMKEIKEFIHKTVDQVEKTQNIDLNQCGVLLVGDFNTPSSWDPQYKNMKSLFQGRDLYQEYIKKNNQEEQTTYSSSNSYFTTLKETNVSRRIDYIFALDQLPNSENQKKVSFLPLTAQDFSIETQPKGEELSDHWPQIASIIPQ